MRASALVATYNTHAGIGIDRRFMPQRIADVVGELRADVIALQELRSRANGVDLLAVVRRETGYHAIAGPTMSNARGDFGNGLLSRFPVVSVQHVDLAVGRREPRSAIDAVLDCDGNRLRVVATHLGLARRERHAQVARLLAALRTNAELPTVLLGDLNEWYPHRDGLRRLHESFGAAPSRATFPSLAPMFALDRILAVQGVRLHNVHAHRSSLARLASDHLPLMAELFWENAAAESTAAMPGNAGARPTAEETVSLP